MTFPLTTLAATISSAGISAPSYSDVLTSLQASIAIIYGQDVYLDNSTPDGQLLAVFAQAMSDANSAAIDTYNSYSPGTAIGAGLSSVVKINGIARLVASFSTVSLLLGGSPGTTITNGVAGDSNGNSWALPSTVTFPGGGSIVVGATCTTPGAIAAAANTINQINSPTRGWSTVNNPSAASTGAPVETDAQLRLRQANSVSLTAITPLASTEAAVAEVANVTEVRAYENPTGATDANGLPPHSIAVVVEGGDPVAIAQTILLKKTPGCYTYGTTSETVVDSAGVPNTINFFRPTFIRIVVNITINPNSTYVAATGTALVAAVAAYINALGIGQNVSIAQLYLPAQLNGGPGFSQYELTGMLISIYPASPGPSDITIPFNSQASCVVGDITLNT